jgi:hypothetical protein
LHWRVNRARPVLVLIAAAVAGLVLVSGGSGADPRTPAALPGLPPPFLGTSVVGAGALTAAVDAYGDVVDLRASPAGPALIDDPVARQAAGTVPADTGIVPRVRVGGGAARPVWRADSVAQLYLPGTSVVRTVARFGDAQASVLAAAGARSLAVVIGVRGGVPAVSVDLEAGARCVRERRVGRLALLCGLDRAVPPAAVAAGDVLGWARRLVRSARTGDRRWLARARPLGPGAPPWARRMFRRSLLALRALTDRRSGAVAAGARDGWAYVWPRDAATAALAFEAAGYRAQARRVAAFLAGLDLGAAARFDGNGSPVPGRGPQGDAPGWVAAAARAAGVPIPAEAIRAAATVDPARAPDYQEGPPGDYLANALSRLDGPKTRRYQGKSARRREGDGVLARFGTPEGLVRGAGDPGSGLDSAAAWAVRPFARSTLYPAARETLVRLLAAGTRFGITPGEGWSGGSDPWTAPTAWSAWALAALAHHEPRSPGLARADRRRALRLLADLQRAATPAGSLPERVDARTGVPRSTTPLAWSHAFAILALRQLWPSR